MSTQLAVPIGIFAASIVCLVVGAYGSRRWTLQVFGLGLLAAGFMGMFLWFPSLLSSVSSEETAITEIAGAIANALYWAAPWVLFVIGLFLVYVTVELFGTRRNVDLVHLNMGASAARPATPDAAHPATPDAARPATPAPRQIPGGVIVSICALIAMIMAVNLWAHQPDRSIKALCEIAQRYDEEVGSQFDADWRWSGLTRAKITLAGEWLKNGEECKTLVLEKANSLPDSSEWKELNDVIVTSVTFISMDGQKWTHAVIHFDGTLKANLAKKRAAAEAIKNASVRIQLQESKKGETTEEVKEMTDTISRALAMKKATDSTSNVVSDSSSKKPGPIPVMGKGLFRAGSPSGFRR